MKSFSSLLLALATLIALHARGAQAVESDHRFRIEPHEYLGTRGNEPTFQNLTQAFVDWRGSPRDSEPWAIQLHWEAESLGRRDASLDLDRAWFRTGDFTIGRIHPWDISQNPEATRPWGLFAQTQPQNRGVLLGDGYSKAETFPTPVLMGWLGVHFWSDRSQTAAFAWGVSASPIFLPSLGSEVSLSDSQAASSGRFGRRPPGFVDVNGSQLPLRYEIDRSRLIQDVLLQPQIAAQARWKAGSFLTGWLVVSRAPVPDPQTQASGFVRVSGSGVDALAQVTPKFPELWLGTLNHRLKIGPDALGAGLFNSLEYREDGAWGYELGADCRYGSLSILDQPNAGTNGGSTADGNSPSASISGGRYTDLMAQAEARVPLERFAIFGGIKTNLRQNSTWVRGGTTYAMTSRALLEAGMDVFGGDEGSYFGEWRTNDRIYLALTWRLDR